MVQHRAARFVKGRYGMHESVTQMLEELTCVPLSKQHENACLILFYKNEIINNLAMMPHSCLEKADGRTRKKHSMKFRHIGYNVDLYGQSFFPKSIIKALTSTTWGKQKETIVATYKAVTRLTLEYASSIWLPMATPTSINKLQVMQNAALRACTGFTHDTNIQHLHDKTNILPIQKHLQLHASQVRQKAQYPSHPLHITPHNG